MFRLILLENFPITIFGRRPNRVKTLRWNIEMESVYVLSLQLANTNCYHLRIFHKRAYRLAVCCRCVTMYKSSPNTSMCVWLYMCWWGFRILIQFSFFIFFSFFLSFKFKAVKWKRLHSAKRGDLYTIYECDDAKGDASNKSFNVWWIKNERNMVWCVNVAHGQNHHYIKFKCAYYKNCNSK